MSLERTELFFKHVILYCHDIQKTYEQAYNYIKDLRIYKKMCIPSLETVRLWYDQILQKTLFINEYGSTSSTSSTSVAEASNQSENTEEIQNSDEYQLQIKIKALEEEHSQLNYGCYRKAIKKLEEEQVDKSQFFIHVVQYRYSVCVALFSRFMRKKSKFLNQIVVGSEKWISYQFPKKRESLGSSSNIKVKVCVWWNYEGVLFYIILNEHDKLNSHEEQLRRLEEELKKKPLPSNKKLKVILLHNSFADVDTLQSVYEKALSLKWEILPHPRYSRDIVPDYYLFRSINEDLYTVRLQNVEQVRAKIENLIVSKDKTFWEAGMNKLEKQWRSVIERDGLFFS